MNTLKKNGTTSGDAVLRTVEKGRPLFQKLKSSYNVADSLIKGAAPKAKSKAKAKAKSAVEPAEVAAESESGVADGSA